MSVWVLGEPCADEEAQLLLPHLVTLKAQHHITSVACGAAHVLATDQGRSLFSWGDNARGQLGDGTLLSRQQPKLVARLEHYKIGSFACGYAHSVVLVQQMEPYEHCERMDFSSQVEVVLSSRACDAVQCFSWGDNGAGQLGREAHLGSPDPWPGLVQLESIRDSELVLDGTKNAGGRKNCIVACGLGHTCVITKKGEVISWGANQWGQCGRFPENQSMRPGLVLSMQKKHIKLIACGAAHTLVGDAKGVAYSFGCNTAAQLGDGAHGDQPQALAREILLPVGFRPIQLACGEEFSCALGTDGRLLTWGNGSCGQLGHGSFLSLRYPKEVSCEFLTQGR